MKYWSHPTWDFLHSLTIKIRDDRFIYERQYILQIINNVIMNLNCPMCKENALKNMSWKHLNKINSKNDLILYIYNFHNWVNQKTNKPIQPFEIINQYYNKNFSRVYNNYIMMIQRTRAPDIMTNRRYHIRFTHTYFLKRGRSFWV
tara:strand:+ start:7907 stop:8344 length:438 start_codon:yes stop_codon:yes gene_type:complete